jgi:hypothetical protein
VLEVLEQNPVIGDAYLFPAPSTRGRPWTRYHARDLLSATEQRGGVIADVRLHRIAG